MRYSLFLDFNNAKQRCRGAEGQGRKGETYLLFYSITQAPLPQFKKKAAK
jgi:hypothetical protein